MGVAAWDARADEVEEAGEGSECGVASKVPQRGGRRDAGALAVWTGARRRGLGWSGPRSAGATALSLIVVSLIVVSLRCGELDRGELAVW